jgi:hypothetical protein
LANAKHPDELFLEALQERFYADLKLLWDWYHIEGRPAFGKKLTPAEMLARFADPVMRQETEARLQHAVAMRVEKPDAVLHWYDDMTRLAQKAQAGG